MPSAPRQKLVGKLPIAGEFAARHVFGAQDCPKYARGEGHQVFVLTVSYPGGRTRQFRVRRERVDEVRRWLNNYQELKEAIEAIAKSITNERGSVGLDRLIGLSGARMPAAPPSRCSDVHLVPGGFSVSLWAPGPCGGLPGTLGRPPPRVPLAP